MPRDADALRLTEKWARDGDRTLPTAHQRTFGWDVNYSQVGGLLGPERRIVNQLLSELTALAAEINAHGLLPWSPLVNYVHTAFVMGSDGQIYVSRQASGPANGTATDPTGAGATAYWRPY